MTELLQQLTGVLINLIALTLGALIALYFTGHIRNFLEMARVNNTINNLRRERKHISDQLAETKKRNTLLQKVIAQRDVQINLLKEALADREQKINDLAEHLHRSDELFIEYQRTIRTLEQRVEDSLNIAREREQRIFSFLKKYVDPDVDQEEIIKLLNLDNEPPTGPFLID